MINVLTYSIAEYELRLRGMRATGEWDRMPAADRNAVLGSNPFQALQDHSRNNATVRGASMAKTIVLSSAAGAAGAASGVGFWGSLGLAGVAISAAGVVSRRQNGGRRSMSPGIEVVREATDAYLRSIEVDSLVDSGSIGRAYNEVKSRLTEADLELRRALLDTPMVEPLMSHRRALVHSGTELACAVFLYFDEQATSHGVDRSGPELA